MKPGSRIPVKALRALIDTFFENGNLYLPVRSMNNYRGRGFFLPSFGWNKGKAPDVNLHWEIKSDKYGTQVLICYVAKEETAS